MHAIPWAGRNWSVTQKVKDMWGAQFSNWVHMSKKRILPFWAKPLSSSPSQGCLLLAQAYRSPARSASPHCLPKEGVLWPLQKTPGQTISILSNHVLSLEKAGEGVRRQRWPNYSCLTSPGVFSNHIFKYTIHRRLGCYFPSLREAKSYIVQKSEMLELLGHSMVCGMIW